MTKRRARRGHQPQATGPIPPAHRLHPPPGTAARPTAEQAIAGLQHELRKAQTVLVAIAHRDGRIRVSAADLQELDGRDFELHFRQDQGGALVIEATEIRAQGAKPEPRVVVPMPQVPKRIA